MGKEGRFQEVGRIRPRCVVFKLSLPAVYAGISKEEERRRSVHRARLSVGVAAQAFSCTTWPAQLLSDGRGNPWQPAAVHGCQDSRHWSGSSQIHSLDRAGLILLRWPQLTWEVSFLSVWNVSCEWVWSAPSPLHSRSYHSLVHNCLFSYVLWNSFVHS